MSKEPRGKKTNKLGSARIKPQNKPTSKLLLPRLHLLGEKPNFGQTIRLRRINTDIRKNSSNPRQTTKLCFNWSRN